jgi:hypothetical protein
MLFLLVLGPGLSRDGERYVDEEMKRALFGVKRMKEVMEKNQEKHEHLMKTLKESSDKRKVSHFTDKAVHIKSSYSNIYSAFGKYS